MEKIKLLAAILMMGLMACCEEIDETQSPDTPIQSGDWVTFSSDGGIIEKGDITIQFPSGTFTNDTKVAVSEVKAGQICGDLEVSKFYQITLPYTCAKSFTVKIKCETKGDDVNAIVHAPAMAVGPYKQIYANCTIESTYSNGEYTFVIPASDNQKSTDNASISVGIAQIQRIPGESDGTRAVGGISWHYDISVFHQQKYLDNWKKAKYPSIISSALENLQDLGFKISGNRNLPVSFVEEDEDTSGYLVQSGWNDIFNGIALNDLYITDFDRYNQKNPVKRTVIHELTHYYQSSGYDPRWPVVKKATDGDERMIYECSAVWTEKFNDGGDPSLGFVSTYLPRFLTSLTEVKKAHEDDKEAKNPYADHGYGMASLIEYFTTQRKSEGFNDKSVVELYDIMKSSSAGLGTELSGTTFDFLKAWAKKHNSKFFEKDGYDDFILKLMTAKVYTDMKPSQGVNGTSNQLKDEGEVSHSGKCYPYGAYICRTQLLANSKSDKFIESGSLKNKRLVVDQKQEGVQTYVVVQYQGGLKQIDGKATKNSPLIINGKTLESFRKNESYNVNFFIISTNCDNQATLTTETIVCLEENQEDDNPSDWEGVLWEVKGFELWINMPVHVKSEKKSNNKVESKEYDSTVTLAPDHYSDNKFSETECKTTPLGQFGIHVEYSWKSYTAGEFDETGKLTFDVTDSRTRGDIENVEYTFNQWSKDTSGNVRKFYKHLSCTGLRYNSNFPANYWQGINQGGKNDDATPDFKVTDYDDQRDEQYASGGYWIEDIKLRSVSSDDNQKIHLKIKY